MYEPQPERKVALGAILLDQHKPGWYSEIDLPSLDIQSCDLCVLAQIFGRFDEGRRELGISIGEPFGFAMNTASTEPLENRRRWKELRKLWIEEIESRLLSHEVEGVIETELVTA